MITVGITLQVKLNTWHIVAYHIDSTQEDQPVVLPGPLKRQFLSPEAATSYIKRLVLGRLKLQRPDASDADVVCNVTVRSQE
jgi:hypothetical protein